MNKFLAIAFIIAAGFLVTSCDGEEAESSAKGQNDVSTAEIDSHQISYFTVETESVTDRIFLSGRLRADKRIELFPEVQGKVMGGNRPFKEGISYQKGEILLQLDDEEARLQYQSSRSKFKTLVSALMADIKLDHPELLPRYEEWFNTLSIGESNPPVPDFGEKAQRFLESKGVYELYYSIKSAEERLSKFTIRAPFSGILSAVKAEPGQAVGPQFHLGTLVDPSLFILSASVEPADADWIRPGMTLKVLNQDQTGSYKADVVRVNPSVDPSSQQVFVYLEVAGENLREGMYLEGEIESDSKKELARIPKTALLRTGGVLVKTEGSLVEAPVQIENLDRSYLWVSGLKNGDEIVENASEPVAGRIIN